MVGYIYRTPLYLAVLSISLSLLLPAGSILFQIQLVFPAAYILILAREMADVIPLKDAVMG
jgi:hypothetical protein